MDTIAKKNNCFFAKEVYIAGVLCMATRMTAGMNKLVRKDFLRYCICISKETVAAWKMKLTTYEHKGLEVNILFSLVI